MAPVSLKPTQKGVTMLAIAAVAIFVCCLLACLGSLAKVRDVDGQLAKAEKQVRESEKIAETQRESENRYIDTRAQIRFLESSVSTQAYVPTLLKQIEHLGKSVNLRVIGVRPQPVTVVQRKPAPVEGESSAATDGAASAEKKEPPKPYDELIIDLQVEGKYMNALDFLYRLTSFPKILAVNTVQMSPSGINSLSGSPKLTIDINVTAYVFKEAPAATEKKTETVKVEGRTGNEAG